MVTLKVSRLDQRVQLPEYASEGATGMDLRAFLTADLPIPPMGRARVPTGIKIEIPPGYDGQVRPRSGLAIKSGITVLNSPGTIDSDYRGGIDVILVNLGAEPFTVKDGDRIAQLVIAPVVQAELVEVTELSATDRGGGGFGSTGS